MGNLWRTVEIPSKGGMSTKEETINVGFIRLKELPFPSGLLIERVDFPKNILNLKSAEANQNEDVMWERKGLLSSVDTFIRIHFRESVGFTGETVVEFNHLWTWNDENG